MHMCAHSHLQMEEISSLLPVSAKDVRCSDGTLTIGPMTAVHIGLTEQSMQSVFNWMRIVSVKQWLCAPLRIRKGWERWVLTVVADRCFCILSYGWSCGFDGVVNQKYRCGAATSAVFQVTNIKAGNITHICLYFWNIFPTMNKKVLRKLFVVWETLTHTSLWALINWTQIASSI